ncbi:hypothetical protein HK099_002997 [Clydaea vesicula]|uniref:Uncharacterized protein n=1 Tax=Clydaea vesicula TaxID=447962 RepID=A0AAD5XWH1_9FUNG|nr:hypothetical protein HK099_002997 [Clydaea vesicula]KAJ3385882.1 hypothetical protein HDU92_002820 [Lobulomyces angularis]
MKFSVLATVFLSTFAAASYITPLSKRDPLPYEDIQLIVDGANEMIQKYDQDMVKIITDAKLDPKETLAQGSTSGQVNIGICKARGEVGYYLTNLVGLKKLNIKNVEYVSNDFNADAGLLTLVIKAGINPIDLSVDVLGHAIGHCGFLHPHVDISGNVDVNGMKIDILTSIVLDINNGVTVTAAEIAAVAVDFTRIDIDLDGFGIIFNPLLDIVTDSIRGRIKAKLISLVDDEIKPVLQKVVNSKLPFKLF